MPKGDNLKQLWSNPEWRAQRIKDLRENQAWIDRRAAQLGMKGLNKARKNRKRKATAKNYDLERSNATLLFELAAAKEQNEAMMARLQEIYIVHDIDSAHDPMNAGLNPVRRIPLSCSLTEEESLLIKAARVALGMTKGTFLREAAIFYAMWAVDVANKMKLPRQEVAKAIGIRADIEEDIEVWRAFKTAAE